MLVRMSVLSLVAAALALVAGPALARCSKNLVERLGPGTQLASLDGLQFAKGGSEDSPNRALITFVGHASYQIDTPQGVRAITDYNGVNGFGRHPDIVTMNNAHSTHFTDQPEDGIAYVLQGWPKEPARARPSTTSATRTCGCGTCRPTPATGAPGRPASTATRSSSSRSATSASPIWAICTIA